MRSLIAVSRDTPFSFFIAKMTLTADSELFPYMRFLNVLQWLAEWFPSMLESSHRCWRACMPRVGLFLHFWNTWLPFKDLYSECLFRNVPDTHKIFVYYILRWRHLEILCITQLVRCSPFRRQHYMLYDLNSANTVPLCAWFKASAARCKWNLRPCGMLRSFDW